MEEEPLSASESKADQVHIPGTKGRFSIQILKHITQMSAEILKIKSMKTKRRKITMILTRK